MNKKWIILSAIIILIISSVGYWYFFVPVCNGKVYCCNRLNISCVVIDPRRPPIDRIDPFQTDTLIVRTTEIRQGEPSTISFGIWNRQSKNMSFKVQIKDLNLDPTMQSNSSCREEDGSLVPLAYAKGCFIWTNETQNILINEKRVYPAKYYTKQQKGEFKYQIVIWDVELNRSYAEQNFSIEVYEPSLISRIWERIKLIF